MEHSWWRRVPGLRGRRRAGRGRSRWSAGAVALGCAVALAAGCASADGPARATSAAPPGSAGTGVVGAGSAAGAAQVGRYASPNPGSVNTLWLRTSAGLLVVDTGRSLTDARQAVAAIRRTGQPVAAILITHPHPDHVGGIGVLHQAFPTAPVYASQATVAVMRTDPLGYYDQTRALPHSDYAARLSLPDHVVAPGATVDVGGTQVRTAEFGAGESSNATVYYVPATGDLFVGDLVSNGATPALIEGHTCGWLGELDQVQARFPQAVTLHPGHGAPGRPADLIARQRSYLHQFRELVRAAIAPASPGGATVTPAEQDSIIAVIERNHPGYPPVATLPDLQRANIKAVAGELATTNPAAEPAACRDA